MTNRAVSRANRTLFRAESLRRLHFSGRTPIGGRVGRLAQLVERLAYTEDVGSSSLSSPTIPHPSP